MPPKKKKPTPIVVGTVSTRSTRRESIVNIKIIPKANKSSGRAPAPKKSPLKSLKTPDKSNTEQGILDESEKTSPEILEILKDWSDDENSQDTNLLPTSSGHLIVVKNEHNSRSVSVDEQSLIDILEGNHVEPPRPKLINKTKPLEGKPLTLKNQHRVTSTKELAIDNPIVSVDSPQIESEIIEECVGEDGSIIIELPEEEEQMEMTVQDRVNVDKELTLSVEDLSMVDNKLGSPLLELKSRSQVDIDGCSDNKQENLIKQNQFNINMEDKGIATKKIEALLDVKHSSDLNECGKHSLRRIDEENRSVTSEDTTSQSMITVQDEDACDFNDVQMSDNSTNNYEVIEEQVVFDSSEPIIIDNLDSINSDNVSGFGLQQNRNQTTREVSSEVVYDSTTDASKNSIKGMPKEEPSEVVDFPSKAPKVKQHFYVLSKDNSQQVKQTGKKEAFPVIHKTAKKVLLRSSNELQEFTKVQKSPVISDNLSLAESDNNSLIEVTASKASTSSSVSTSLSSTEDIPHSTQIEKRFKEVCISNQKDSLGSNRQKSKQITNLDSNISPSGSRQEQCLKSSETQFQDKNKTKTKTLDDQSEENTLCKKLSDLMDLTKESSSFKDFDPASEKLQEGIQKMNIQEKFNRGEDTSKASGNTGSRNKESKSLVDNTETNKKETGSKKCQLTSTMEEEKQGILLNLAYPQARQEKSVLDCESQRTSKSYHSGKDMFEADIKPRRRRSTRWKPIEDDETDKQEGSISLQNISNKDLLQSNMDSTFEYSFQDKQYLKQSGKSLEIKDTNIQKKEDMELQKPNSDYKIFDVELDSNKDDKSCNHSKGKSLVTKMDIDSESSETKTSEVEGDSTSNESSQSSNSAKIYKKGAKKDIELNLETELNKSDFDMDISIDDNNLTKKPKGIKTTIKKASRNRLDEEMRKIHIDSDKPANASDSIKLQANIDATIDEVLRKYTLDDPGTPEGCASPKDFKLKAGKSSRESKKKKEAKYRRDEKYETSEEVRRSDRIKTILPIKKKSHGLVRSKSESALSVEAESSDSNSVHSELDKVTPVSPQLNKKYKAKSRAKSSENLQITNSGSLLSENSPPPKATDLKADKSGKAEIEARLKTFFHLKENQYKTDRQVCKEAREMICDCYLAEEDIQKDEYGCGEDCLNRLLMIECGHLCQIGDRCTNKRFQKTQFAPVEIFKTEKKGLGLIAAANIPYGEFILEYVGEVLNQEEFDKRAEVYSKDKNIHFYFMSLRADAIIDATMKGNISRFINHSCDPNAETQKWTVNGELRIGFFSTRTILAGEEVTFDYKFQRYGKEAQKCYCGATTCRGWLGERPDESEDEDEEEDEELSKAENREGTKLAIKMPSPVILQAQDTRENEFAQVQPFEKMEIDAKAEVAIETTVPQEASAASQLEETPKKATKKKARKEILFEDFDQLNEDIEMVVTTGLKNQAHTLKLSRLMVRSKDLDQRKKLLRVLRRGELPCRRLFLDYHGLRLMHGYMIDAQQLTNGSKKSNYSNIDFLQTKLELLQTLAVLPIQNKTMLIESKVLAAVEKWAKNEDLVEDGGDAKLSPKELNKQDDSRDPVAYEKIDEIKFLASKLLEEWVNLKQSFRIPKKQRIEQMKEHEKEANRKFESSYTQEKESSRKNDQRYRSWSRYKSERETNKKGHREDKDRPSAEYLKMSKHERRKLFALQMELKEEERRLKQREMWRQHEMNCMLIGADPRFTAPFDPSKGFQYIWNPSIGQWQALPVPSSQSQGVTGYNVPPTSQGVSGYNMPPTHKSSLLGPYTTSMLNVAGIAGPTQQYPAPQKNSFNTGTTCDLTRGLQPTIAPMVPGLSTSVSSITNAMPGISTSMPGIAGLVSGMAGTLHGISGSAGVMSGSVPGITQPPLPALPMYPEVKQSEEDPSQVKFAGPIPPPAKLPPKWKCAKDKYGRPYYYHVKARKSQWEPPRLPEEGDESSETSSSETSSLSSSDSSSDCDTDDEIDDTKLLMEVKKHMETKIPLKSVIPHHVKKEEKDSSTPSPEVKVESDNEDETIEEEIKEEIEEENSEQLSSIDIRLKEQFNLDSNDPPQKKRRIGLCQEIIISPRTEADRQQFKEDLKRYKATKEKLKRQKDHMVHQAKKKLKTSIGTSDDTKRSKDKRLLKSTAKSRIKQMEWNDEHAKKIKEVFRSTMATTVVGVLNAYRKPDCKESRITNTDDFKHLARKLTHFVMLKEMKHINTIDELICTDNVKAKAREYIKKYMSKFGEVYQKRHDEPDFKD